MEKKKETPTQNVAPRDGYDNTGTQGYDSLTDDAFTGSSNKPNQHVGENASGTGSASNDFPDSVEQRKGKLGSDQLQENSSKENVDYYERDETGDSNYDQNEKHQ